MPHLFVIYIHLLNATKRTVKFMCRRNSNTKDGPRLILHIFARPVMFIGQKLKFKITRIGTENPISIACPRKKLTYHDCLRGTRQIFSSLTA